MDAFTKLKQQKAEAEDRRRHFIEQGVADYSIAVERRKSLEESLRFSITDEDALTTALKEVSELWEAFNACVPGQFRTEYEARIVTKKIDVGRLM